MKYKVCKVICIICHYYRSLCVYLQGIC